MDSVVLAARLALACVFAVAGVAKLVDRPGAQRALVGFGLSGRAPRVFATVLPVIELCVAALLLPASTARMSALAGLALIGAFCFGIARAMLRGETPDCHCFGQLHSAPAGGRTLARNATLAVLALFVAVAGPGASSARTLDPSVGPAVIAVAVCAIVAALALWRSNRDLRAEIRGLRAGIGTGGPDGLPIGTLAPWGFEARTLVGVRLDVADLHKRGRPLLVLFLDVECPSCGLVIEQAVGWQRRLRNRLEIVVVSGGGPEQSKRLVEEYGLVAENVLVQQRRELFDAFRVTATPAATLIGTDGRVSATTASTALQIEVLVRLALNREHREQAVPAQS